MSKFKKNNSKGTPAISTASLPDIIFMLLFFFMVVTVLRDAERKVDVVTPSATELTKFENKSLVNYMYVGRPVKKYQETYGTKPRMQLGDKFATVEDIPLFLEKHKSTIPESQQPGITTSLRIDGKVTMGIVTDIKVALRKANQLKLNYSAKPRADK
jgi:biopolymer transport protein ExbD